MEYLFSPRSVAVIGASKHKEKLGFQIFANIVNGGYKGKIYPINPEATEILGLKAYPSILDTPTEIDLAVIIVPAPIVIEVVKQCLEKKVKYAVIISAGFSESGAHGHLLQEQLKKIVVGSSLRLVGPNCLGIFNTKINLNSTFAAPQITAGNVSAVLQSGALGVALLDIAKSANFGFAKFISLGNKIDLNESDILEYLAEDPDTKVIVLYLETITNLTKFVEICRQTSKNKPIVVLKGGMTKRGAKAAFSHTAAITSPAMITKAVFSQSNIIFTNTIEEMIDVLCLLSFLPSIPNNNLAILTNAGGPAILATDMACEIGLELPLIKEKVKDELKIALPKAASVSNPIDLAGDALAKDYQSALDILVKDENLGSILCILTPQTTTQIPQTAETIVKFKNKKSIITSFIGAETVRPGIEILNKNKIPHFSDPSLALLALKKVADYHHRVLHADTPIRFSEPKIKFELGDPLALIKNYRIPLPPTIEANSKNEALKLVKKLHFPVVVKGNAKFGEHKFKAGKVVLNVSGEKSLEDAIDKVGLPVIVQQMIKAPYEVIVGAKRDQENGIAITFGWGGVFVEDIKDLSVRVLPLTEYDLCQMISETKIGKVLLSENINLTALKNIIINMARIMNDFPTITEMDLNPVMISEKETFAVDCRYLACDEKSCVSAAK